jgi:Mg2+-importing ATPase
MGEIARFMLLIGPISSIFDYTTFAVMYFYFNCTDATALAQITPELAKLGAGAIDHTHAAQLFHTGWFVESIMTQTLIIHVIRTDKIPFLQSRASWPLIVGSVAVVVLGVWLTVSPFAGTLGFAALPPRFWLFLCVTMVAYAALAQAVKSWFVRRFGD